MTGPGGDSGALGGSAGTPYPLRTVARKIGDWIGRLGRVWVEGQLTEVNRRPGTSIVFLMVRDPVADVSLRVNCSRAVWDALRPPPVDGARVVMFVKPDFNIGRGQLTLNALEIRPVGVGELLARLERLKQQLGAEGLFAAERKRQLPFLPRTIGLVTGRGSAAERDVVETGRRRWPGVEFEIREVAVQGPLAVSQVTEALRSLDRLPQVDVIIIARGGGSLEDLLPFSDESLCRAVAEARTPVVSAIGHEPDSPLLDLVADLRAATPTDAARRVVPDREEEWARISVLRDRGRRCLAGRLDGEQRALTTLRSRPVLAAPGRALDRLHEETVTLRDRARRCTAHVLAVAQNDLVHATTTVRALSPAATLARGYAVAQLADGAVLRDPAQAPEGSRLRLRVEHGELAVVATTGEAP